MTLTSANLDETRVVIKASPMVDTAGVSAEI